MWLELAQLHVIMDRIEARVNGQLPFINPCPSGDEWLAMRKLLDTIEKEAN